MKRVALAAIVLLAAAFGGARADQVSRADVTWVYPGCTVGVSSAQCLASTAGMLHRMTLENKSATANIACSWNAAATTASLTDNVSFKLGPLMSLTYSVIGATPSGPLFCISDTATTHLYIEGF